jgi:hypothetical protein
MERGMTIKYLDSQRLTGVASDTKPTTLSEHSIFIDTDTANRFIFNGGRWKRTSVFDSLNESFTHENQRFVEWFSGKKIPSYWTERNGLSGDGTVSTSYAVMADEVNGGVKLSSNTGTWGKSSLSFNGKRQYDATASVMIFVGRRTGHSVGYNITGLSDHVLIWDNAPQEVGIKNYSEDSSFRVITSDGTNQSETDFSPTVSIDTNFHQFKIENTSTSNSGYIDGVLGLTKTTNRPTGKVQPQMLAMTKAAEQASAINQIRYMECYNT